MMYIYALMIEELNLQIVLNEGTSAYKQLIFSKFDQGCVLKQVFSYFYTLVR